jgi:hypothetical protein
MALTFMQYKFTDHEHEFRPISKVAAVFYRAEVYEMQIFQIQLSH